MISLKHLQIVKDAAFIELAMSDGINKELKKSAINKLIWVFDNIKILSLETDICPNCKNKGKSTYGKKSCKICRCIRYIE